MVTALATSAVAAQLHRKERTAHSKFWIFIPYNEDSTCHINVSFGKASKLQQANFIIWDEERICMPQNIEDDEINLKNI